MSLFKKEREVVQEATNQLAHSSELLLAVAGLAVVISAIALIFAIRR
jgi:hypothetical protein